MSDDTRHDEGFGIGPDDTVEFNSGVPADDILDDEISDEEPTDADIQDEPTPENDVEEQPEEESDSEIEEVVSDSDTAKYRIVGLLPVFDKLGNAIAPVAIGSVHEYPVEYGDGLVSNGLAVREE